MSEEAEHQPKQMNVVNFLQALHDSPSGSPLYFKSKNESASEANILRFDRHFNQDLAADSNYFKSLSAFMRCVEKNAEKELTEAQQERVCSNEYKALRLRSFDNQLMYHNVNKRFFQNELSLFHHESPY